MMKAEETVSSCSIAFCTYVVELRHCWKLFGRLYCLMEDAYHMVIINKYVLLAEKKKVISLRASKQV